MNFQQLMELARQKAGATTEFVIEKMSKDLRYVLTKEGKEFSTKNLENAEKAGVISFNADKNSITVLKEGHMFEQNGITMFRTSENKGERAY